MSYKEKIEKAFAQEDFAEAVRVGKDWCEKEPLLALARNLSGIALMQSGDLPAAIASFIESVCLDPGYAKAWHNLGVAYLNAGQAMEAISAHRQAFELAPADMGITSGFVELLSSIGDYVGARDVLTKALISDPENPSLFLKLGVVAKLQGNWGAAKEAIQKAITLDPGMHAAHNELGVLMRKEGNDAEAELCYRAALEINAKHADALNNLGDIYFSQLKFKEAELCFRQAISVAPNLASAHFNLGLLLLTRGEFQAGWKEYRWRLQILEARHKVRQLSKPEWQGGDLVGKRLLVHAEQGFGDSIQFVRYMPVLKQLGATVIFEAPKELMRLFGNASGIDVLVERGWPIPEYDMHVPVMSIPGFVGTTLENIPNQTPYLHADEAESRLWSERLKGSARLRRVGIVWAGNPHHLNDRNRSIPAGELKGLRGIDGVRWINLNKLHQSKTKTELPIAVEDWANEFSDFAVTAALIDNLDLVISVDTAVAHLAGALGKQVWVLLPYAAEWRWLQSRLDSPWYPSVKLFRQSIIGDWRSVIQGVHEGLSLEKKAP